MTLLKKKKITQKKILSENVDFKIQDKLPWYKCNGISTTNTDRDNDNKKTKLST